MAEGNGRRRGDAPEDVQARRRRLGETLRGLRGDLTQAELALRLGRVQSVVSAWESGDGDLSAEQARAVDATLELPTGTLLARAGYVDATSLWSDPRDVLRKWVFGRCDDAFKAVRAADRLGFGVRLWNEIEPYPTAEGLLAQCWVVEARLEPGAPADS